MIEEGGLDKLIVGEGGPIHFIREGGLATPSIIMSIYASAAITSFGDCGGDL